MNAIGGPVADDADLLAFLAQVGADPSALLGEGGEAQVFALDDERVLRVLRPGGQLEVLKARDALVGELRRGAVPFALPEVLEAGVVNERAFAIERRLRGNDIRTELATLDRAGRDQLVVAHLDAVAGLGDLHLDERPWFGDLMGAEPVRCATWSEWLHERVAISLDRAPGFGHLDAASIADALPGDAAGDFMHLDAFVGNMLAVGTEVTAVIDIGLTSARGDRRLDVLSAVVYLCADEITPIADEDDRRVARQWLADAGLGDLYEPARRWMAAYWAWAVDDPDLHHWCRRVLLT